MDYCCRWRSGTARRGGQGKCRGATRGVGLYPEWAALGIREGASPEAQSEAGRMVALQPSIQSLPKPLWLPECPGEEIRAYTIQCWEGSDREAANERDRLKWGGD